MSQGDALMKRKMENLVQRHQSVGSLHPTRTFCFTEQISPTRVRDAGERTSPVPDNWVEPQTGGYFSTRGPGAPQAQPPKAAVVKPNVSFLLTEYDQFLFLVLQTKE
ncbi:Hypothetical protein, putative [Bodo saltans]|uniref:Uncharacterized protein n=1 Tax=Bodo saltans TaxID=75058 RepID=A0A0S4JDP1_BODSA|nr:Hypothetical protein, putative [Bodo saltans]|eukprot:CUG88284.1 Hypothetical protein, putative [Bodo saltans]